MPESRLQRTRGAYEGEVAFTWTGYGLCARCGHLHSDRDVCGRAFADAVAQTLREEGVPVLWPLPDDECPCEACVQGKFA